VRRWLATVVLAWGGCGLVAAQEPTPEGPGRARDEAFKMIDAYIVSNLQEGLGLDDAQFARMIPLVKRLQQTRREFVQRRQKTLQEMRRALQRGAAEPRVEGLLAELRRIEREQPAAVRRDMDAIDAVLTPLQQAKYRVMEVEVERKIRELMSQVRARGREPGRPRPDRRPLLPDGR
jgi:hypothetical protein